MKKGFILTLLLALFLSCGVDANLATSPRWAKNSKIEIVNEKTVIFKSVVMISIKTNSANQITYVYDLKHSKLVKVARGSFDIELPLGNYLIQSDKKITKTVYSIIVE